MSQVRILPGAPRIPLVPPLDEITTAAVRTWRGQFAVKGNDSAGAKAYGVLRAIRQSAEDDGLITRNLCRLKGAGHAMKRRESIALTPAALAALADAMPPQWRALTLVSGWCGLRIGEAAGLRHGDVDLEHGVLRIVQTAQYIGAQGSAARGGDRLVTRPDWPVWS